MSLEVAEHGEGVVSFRGGWFSFELFDELLVSMDGCDGVFVGAGGVLHGGSVGANGGR